MSAYVPPKNFYRRNQWWRSFTFADWVCIIFGAAIGSVIVYAFLLTWFGEL